MSDARADRDRWIRAFNRLEKAVTNHITNRCIDSDDLAHVHKAIMRDLGPPLPKAQNEQENPHENAIRDPAA